MIAQAAIPPLLSSPFIIHATIALVPSCLLSSTLLASSSPPSSSTLYSSRRIVQLPTVCPCESCVNNSRSSSIFSTRHTCYHPCCRHPYRHRTCRVLLAIIQAALSSSTSYSSHRIVQLPSVCLSQSCANNLTKLVDLLAASYLLLSTLLVSTTPSSLTSYSSRRIVQLPTVCPSESCANNSRSSSIFSPPLNCYHPRHRRPH